MAADALPNPANEQPQLDFDGRYHVERVDGVWYLCGPAFREGGKFGMTIPGENPELVDKYRDLAQLLNAVVDAERRRQGDRQLPIAAAKSAAVRP